MLLEDNIMNKGAMAIAIDLIIDSDANTLCQGLCLDSHVYEDKPSECPDCKCRMFREYEILGSLPEPIIWECRKCGIRFPKYPIDTMELILEKVRSLWTNPDDWIPVSRKDYN